MDREIADFCTWAFLERISWDQILRRIVTGYAADGFSLSEMTDDFVPIPVGRFPAHAGNGRGICPTGFHEIPANTITNWYQSKADPTQLHSVRQWLHGSDVEPSGYRDVPADRIVRLTYEQQGAYFPGLPLLRSAYGPWKLKIAFQAIDAIKHERTGVGFPIVTAAENSTDEDLDAAEKILAEMRSHQKGYLVLPFGYTFTWAGSTTSDGTNINEAIERCNKDIAINVMAGWSLLGLTGKTGSYALGETQQGAYHLSTVAHAKFVGDAFSIGFDGWSAVDRTVKLNYGNDAIAPRLEARNLPTRNWADVIPVLNASTTAGLITPDDPLEEEVREALQFGPRDETTSRERPNVTTNAAK